MTWTALPEGEKIVVPKGATLAVVASVKTSHTAADLQAFAQKRGLVLSDFAVEGQRVGLGPDPRGPDYHYVAATGTATSDVTLPWEVPWPASMFDDSKVIQAWLGTGLTPASPPAPAPAPPAPATLPSVAVPWGTYAFFAVVVAATVDLWKMSRRRRARARR